MITLGTVLIVIICTLLALAMLVVAGLIVSVLWVLFCVWLAVWIAKAMGVQP